MLTPQQLAVSCLGPARVPSPLPLSSMSGDDLTDFTPDTARLLVHADFEAEQDIRPDGGRERPTEGHTEADRREVDRLLSEHLGERR